MRSINRGLALALLSLWTAMPVQATSYNFSAGSQSLSIADNANLEATIYSVGCWTYRTGTSFSRIMTKGTAAGSTGWGLNYDSTGGGRSQLSVNWGNGPAWYFTAPAASQWHHIAFTYDGSATSNDAIGYLNGVSQSITNPVEPTGSIAIAGTDSIWFGNNSSNAQDWVGNLADCFYINRVLSAGEIKLIMNYGPQHVAGMIGIWHMGNRLGVNVTETSGLNATVTGPAIGTTLSPPLHAVQGGWRVFE